MQHAYICDYARTPIGRFGGALAGVRADDLGAVPLAALKERHDLNWAECGEVAYGCANQAGEDNRNVARMGALLAGFPDTVPGVTLNRLCGSGMDAVLYIARAIQTGAIEFGVAGGVESMSRAPFVMPKATSAFSREAEIYDTTIGWRFVNPLMEKLYGTDSMPETAENVAEQEGVSRDAQDAFAVSSQEKAIRAQQSGRLGREIVPVSIPQRRGEALVVDTDEHPREGMDVEKLARLPTPFREGGTVTSGNASGVNDGAAALLIANEATSETLRTHAPCSHRRRCDGGGRAAHHGYGAGTGHGETDGANGHGDGGLFGHRTERGIRGSGHPRASAAGGRSVGPAGQSEWRSDCVGPSAWRFRRADHRHGGAGDEPERGHPRAGDHVHRCRAGHRHRTGRAVMR